MTEKQKPGAHLAQKGRGKMIKKLNKAYFPLTILFYILLIGAFTLYKPDVVNEYERCYVCNGANCDCETIKETENNTPIWYMVIFFILGVYTLFFSVYRLLEKQKE